MNDEMKHFCVVGTPITHSLSPLMHNAAFEANGVSADFFAHDPLSREGFLLWCDEVALQRGDAKGVEGFCVTVPYKQEARKRCDIISHIAYEIGAVNVMILAGECTFVGHNTDWYGFLASLSQELEKHHLPILSRDTRALVVGTGGVARSIVWALISQGISEIVISSRQRESALSFIEHFSKIALENDVKLIPAVNATAQEMEPFDIVINATPLGLKPNDPVFASDEWLSAHARFVFDAVYSPTSTTALVATAQRLGIPACDGRGMLVEQGVAAQEIWNDEFGFWNNKGDKQRAREAMYRALEHGDGK